MRLSRTLALPVLEAVNHDDLLSGDDRNINVCNHGSLGTICNSIQADNNNADVIHCKVSHVDDSTNLNVDESTMPSDPIVQSVDINTKLKSYAGAAGASAKDQPKVNSNFRPCGCLPENDGLEVFYTLSDNQVYWSNRLTRADISKEWMPRFIFEIDQAGLRNLATYRRYSRYFVEKKDRLNVTWPGSHTTVEVLADISSPGGVHISTCQAEAQLFVGIVRSDDGIVQAGSGVAGRVLHGSMPVLDFCCSKKGLEDKILVPKPFRNCARCARCGTPVDGPYWQGCALLRKKFKEDLFTYCVENEFFKDLQDTSESSDDHTNVVNAPQEAFVYNQDPGENSSPSPPHIGHCCHECGDSLDGIFCRQCSCKFYGKGAHYGYNCLSKVPIISNPEPCKNQTIDDTIVITPVLPIKEPDNSLSMGDENLDTVLATESDEVIKSSVEDLVPIPSDSEGILDKMCDEIGLVFLADDGSIPPGIESDDVDSVDDDTSISLRVRMFYVDYPNSGIQTIDVVKIPVDVPNVLPNPLPHPGA
ncbi:hypothetical protein Tco_1032874 [Tanacetum coccineum]|uniref:Uncharacterized protein n=1 Tax=Tanacetum coccineum TaxID=301880 RepID=A0ABQ5GD19_9ASTR